MQTKNKKIAKNAMFLYIRMILMLFVSLYTSRVLLAQLGVEDYGIYNVVGGLTSIFLFFRSALSSASQRFLNIRIGVNDIEGARRILQQHLTIYCIIAVIFVIIAEPVGLWLIYHKLVIPDSRLFAASIVFHLCVASLVITLVSIVFYAEVIVNEDMKVYSVLSVVEGLARLGICYLISISPFDHLIAYAVLLFLVSIFIHMAYFIYSRRHYAECRIGLICNKALLKETGSIVGWDLYGSVVYMVNDQGINMLLNMFFGPVINAARAVSLQVSNALSNFTYNIQTAFRPQIMKNFASNNNSYMQRLFFGSSKYSLFFFWLLGLPLVLAINPILDLWLIDVPEYTNIFTILVICDSLISVPLSALLDIAMAAGKLKKYMLIGASIFLLACPASYVALLLGFSSISVFIIIIVAKFGFFVSSLFIVSKIGGFSIRDYSKNIILPFIKVVIPSFVLCYVLSIIVPIQLIWGLGLFVCISIVINVVSIWLLGLDNEERVLAHSLIKETAFRKYL